MIPFLFSTGRRGSTKRSSGRRRKGSPWRSTAGVPCPRTRSRSPFARRSPRRRRWRRSSGTPRNSAQAGSSPSSRNGRFPAGRRKSRRRNGSAGRRSPSRLPVSAAGPTFRKSGRSCPSAEMLRSTHPGWLNLICWEEESARGIREVLRDPKYDGTRGFLLVVGPEGGFDKKEIDQALHAGFLSVSLGKRVLRVDTAAAAVLAILQYEKGALGGPEGEVPMADKRFGGFWRRFMGLYDRQVHPLPHLTDPLSDRSVSPWDLGGFRPGASS